MALHRNDFEELGRKVQRAQLALQQVRGIGTANGIRAVVDAENRLLSVTVTDEDAVLAAYNAAVADIQPKLDDAMREVRADPRVGSISTFVEANSARVEVERARRNGETEEENDDYYQQRYRRGWHDG
jgi:hypothetical protein